MEDNVLAVETTGTSVTIQCVQYLISHNMKSKQLIRKDHLLKTVLKGRVNMKNYDRVMEDVKNTLENVFGFSISYINDDKQFIIVNNIEEINIPGSGICYSSSEISKYYTLIKPIIAALVMLGTPISEGQMWNIVEKYCFKFNLDVDRAKTIVKKDFVRDHYLEYKATDQTTIMFDPEKTSFWFSLGPRALIECNQKMVLLRVGGLYDIPVKSFKRLFATLNT